MSSESWIGTVADLLKAPKIFFAVFVAGCFVLFAPASLLDLMGMSEFRRTFSGYIGVATLLSGALLVAHITVFIYEWIRDRLSEREVLHSLTRDEKKYICLYLDNDTPTQHFEWDDGVAHSLELKGIIRRTTTMAIGRGNPAMPFNIRPWARKALKKRRELLS